MLILIPILLYVILTGPVYFYICAVLALKLRSTRIHAWTAEQSNWKKLLI